MKKTASGPELQASSNSHHFSDFLSWSKDKLLVPSMAGPAMCTWSNWKETMVDHSSFLKASNVCSLSLLTSFAMRVQTFSRGLNLRIFPSLVFLDLRDSDIRSDTRSCVFCAVASRVRGETFAYAAPFFCSRKWSSSLWALHHLRDMAYILPDSRGTAGISAAAFAERCSLKTKF